MLKREFINEKMKRLIICACSCLLRINKIKLRTLASKLNRTSKQNYERDAKEWNEHNGTIIINAFWVSHFIFRVVFFLVLVYSIELEMIISCLGFVVSRNRIEWHIQKLFEINFLNYVFVFNYQNWKCFKIAYVPSKVFILNIFI